MKFIAKKGTSAYLGAMPIVFLEDTEMEAPEASDFDHLAEKFAGAGQRVFGDHLSSLAHNEKVTRMIDGVAYEVDVTVTYGAGGARQEADQGEPRKAEKVFAEPVSSEVAPALTSDAVTTPVPSDPLAADRLGEFHERTEFAPPVGRFPSEILAATDVPVDGMGRVADTANPSMPFGTPGASDLAQRGGFDPDGSQAEEERRVGTGESTGGSTASDDLPEDFPSRDLLASAGVTKFSQLEGKTVEELSGDEFPGIGPAKAEDIVAAVKNRK